MDIEVECPWCGAWATIFVDPSGGEEQAWAEECPECRRPWVVHAREEERGGFAVAVGRGEGSDG